jgi:hypothetical protein
MLNLVEPIQDYKVEFSKASEKEILFITCETPDTPKFPAQRLIGPISSRKSGPDGMVQCSFHQDHLF